MFNLFNNNLETESVEVQTDLQRDDLEERDDLLNRIRELEEGQEDLQNRNRELVEEQEDLQNINRELVEEQEDLQNINRELVEEQEDEIDKYKQKYNKMKEKAKEFKNRNRELEEEQKQNNLLKVNDGDIEFIEVSEIKDVDMFEDQRIIYQSHVDKIKKHQIKFFEKNKYFDFPQCLIIAQQKDNNNDFINKKGNRVSELLIDGQHRITAIRQILDEETENYGIYNNSKIPVKIIYLETHDEVKAKFADIHKAKPLSRADKRAGKRAYDGSNILSQLRQRFYRKKIDINEIKYSEMDRRPKSENKRYFYYKIFINKLLEDEHFHNFMSKKSVKREELEKLFVDFHKTVFIRLCKIPFDTIRKKASIGRDLPEYAKRLRDNMKKYNSTQDNKYITYIFGLFYAKKYDQFVSDFYEFCIKEMNYVEKNDEFYSEEEESEEDESDYESDDESEEISDL